MKLKLRHGKGGIGLQETDRKDIKGGGAGIWIKGKYMAEEYIPCKERKKKDHTWIKVEWDKTEIYWLCLPKTRR